MNTKNNQRFNETDLKIQEVMLILMEKHDFEKITVRAVCEKAKINRSTFYAHYLDIYDLMDKMEFEMGKKLQEGYKGLEIDFEMGDLFSAEYLTIFLDFINRNQQFYKVCLRNRKIFPIKRGFDSMWNLIFKPRCEKAGITSEDEMMYYLVYREGGTNIVLRRWLESGCKESSEKIAIILSNCMPEILR